MKMRKLFAGIAAAATLLGGMTLASSAYADENEDGGTTGEQPSTKCELTLGNTITLTGSKNQLTKSGGKNARDYKYVKLASLSTPNGVNDEGQLLDVTTAEDPVKSAVISALKGTEYSADSTVDPMRWVAENLSATDKENDLRTFVNNLAAATEGTSATLTPTSPAADKVVLNTNDTEHSTVQITFDEPGIYLIVDTSGEQTQGSEIYKASSAMLLSTVVSAEGCVINGGSGQTNVKDNNQPSAHLGDYTFTKVDAKTGDTIQGAEFQVYEDSYTEGSSTALKFTVNGGDYKLDKESGTGTTLVTDEDGQIHLTGLRSDHSYVIVETKVGEGYLSDYMARFTITYDADSGTWKATRDDKGDEWNLVDTEHDKVKNVKSITDLPLTGAAGTILFTVVGVLLAGAAATVFARSRYTKRQLMA